MNNSLLSQLISLRLSLGTKSPVNDVDKGKSNKARKKLPQTIPKTSTPESDTKKLKRARKSLPTSSEAPFSDNKQQNKRRRVDLPEGSKGIEEVNDRQP